MPKPVVEVGEGHGDASGNGVYCFIRDLIVEGRDARFVDKNGRYVINWSRALKCYHDYKSKRNPQYKSKNISRRKASNGLRAALLNFYKKEGAKEYKDCKKVNENDEVVERQFQMPPRVFESLFGSGVQLSDDSSEHETSSIGSEADEKPLATPNSSDTGFDEAMDISDDLFNANEEPSSHCALGGLSAGDPQCSNVKTEEDQVDPSDITTPCQMFGISGEDLDSVIGEICSSSDTNDIDLCGVVRDICPSSGSVKGGMQFLITLTEELSEDDKSGIAHFDGIGDVFLERLNCYTLAGTIPASQQPGTVPVTVNRQDGHLLGITCFTYVDEIQEVLKQVVKDPALQSLYLTMWSQEYGLFGNDGDLDPFTLQAQGSSIQGTHAQALKGLQLLVYTAAQTNAQQFIQMIFSTSAGRLVFNAYKDRPQLPEDVARANGHHNLAQYLQDVNARLSKENSNDAQPSSIDWLELIEAVNKIQKQSSVIDNETDLEIGQSKDDDDQSDYFADAETSSCGSFELEIGWSDSEDGEGPCSKGGGSDKKSDVKSASFMNVVPCKAYMCAEVETQSDNDLDLEDDKNSEEGEVKEVCNIGCFGQLIGVATQKRENTSEREQDPRACLDQEKCMQLKSPFTKDEQPNKEPDKRLTPSMEGTSSEEPTVLETNLDNELDQKADGKNDKNLGTTEVGKSSLISQLSKKVAEKWQSGREEEASTVPNQEKTTKPKGTTNWLKGDAVTTSSQQGACVNETLEVPSFRERSYQGVTGGGTQNRENINKRKEDSTTGPSQAKRHKQRTQWRPFGTTLWGSFFLLIFVLIIGLCFVAGIKLREGQLLHWAVRNEHIRISQALLKFVSDVDAPNFRGETPLHVAAKNECKDLAELLMKLGSYVNSKDYQQQTPLNVVAWSGCQGMAKVLIQSGRDVNAEQRLELTPFLLAGLAEHKEIGEVLIIIMQHGSIIIIRDNLGRTPLHDLAVMAQFFIQHGSDVKAGIEKFQLIALHGAAIFGHKQIVEPLIHHGRDVNAGNKFRDTPLHSAVNNFRTNMAEALIQNGSDVNARDIFGQTSLHLAARRGDQEIRRFLIQQGSELKAQPLAPPKPSSVAMAAPDGNGKNQESGFMKRVQTMPDIQIRTLSTSVPDRSASSFPSESLRGCPERIGSSNGTSVSSASLSAKFHRKALPPHQAMLLLKAGNERFIRGRPMAASMNHQARHQLEMFQAPHTAVVGCADCPVPLETIFDAMPGDIFALRNAGNTCTHAEGSMMGSVEFCCSTLGSRLIVVLGHTECRAIVGAARTYLDASSTRHSEDILLELMKSVEKADAELGDGCGSPCSPCSPCSPSRRAKLVQAAVKVNVYRTINYLLQSSSPIQSKVKKGQLEVLGALFDNKTGRVEFMGKSPHEEMILSSSLPSSIAPLLRQAGPRDQRLPAPRKPSPAWALQKLTEGNARFALGTTLDFRSAKPEATYAAVVSCSDCPVSAEAIFDAMPGSLFVLPNAGNTYSQAESSLLGSLEFCTSKLNVPLILILGHRECDAICSCTRMTMDRERQDSFGQDMIMQDLQAVIHRARAEMGPSADINTVADHAIKVNIFQTMEHLLRHSQRLRELVRNSELELQGGIFDKASGCVEFLGHALRLDEVLRLDDDGAASQRSAAAAVSLTSAEAALKLLQEGNSRWISGTAVASRIPKAMAGAETAPFCAVIGCADLRTPVEQIFDSMPGEIFVLRNAGNTITHAKGSMVTSLEFCTCKLMTKLILVLGHTACMALSSAMCVESCAGKASDALVQGIRSASDGSKEISMEEAVELNIYHTMDCLLQYSSCIREKVQTGELEIRGAVYKCATGQVQFLQEAHAGPKETLKGA